MKILEEETRKIWLEMPAEVRAIGQGRVPRRTGSHGQYLSTLIFAEGESRTLSDEILWGLLQVAAGPAADLATLKALVQEIVAYKGSFFDFVGMPRAAGIVASYCEAVEECEDLGQFRELTEAALSYANRLHSWVDIVFPWGVCDGFKRPAEAAEHA